MKQLLGVLGLLAAACCSAWATSVQVQVVAAHSVTRNEEDNRAVLSKGILGSHAVTSQSESFDLQTIINAEHVLLVCDDPKGCESLAAGNYEGDTRRSKWIKLNFALPLSGKRVSRWYKIAGTW